MENIIIVIGLLGIGIFGFFVIKHMDNFTNERKKRKGCIKVAFDSAALIKGMEEKMKNFEGQKENPELFWYAGTQEEVMDMLQKDHVDFVICSDTVLAESHTEYHMARISLIPGTVSSEYQDLKMEPVQMQDVSVTLMWKKKILSRDMHRFLNEVGVIQTHEK